MVITAFERFIYVYHFCFENQIPSILPIKNEFHPIVVISCLFHLSFDINRNAYNATSSVFY